MTPHPAARLLTAAVLIALLVGCSSTPNQPPTPVETTAALVPSPASVGESDPEEGWVGVDELDTTTPMADAHPHDPPGDTQIAAAVTAASTFIVGWLTLDQQQRRQRLEGVAAEALIDSFDDPRFTPAAGIQQGPVHVVDADQMQITTRHRLDTGTAVDVTLILDPDSTHGWIAIAITT
ncbi:hypothetical protein SAMN02745244_01562 [Tessaracoccus bendigoensis DSM 12906]|uniref:DUF3887 domain-containing protein n=1 Tax=Tessaracoccus bendigoensis DSM 12906 TaxID=1123357 RepID=A0A1M6FY53_9ACTN|nr:hypothetical protein [Tessaracoccus bendigoensis]SHJ02623.1 hypothetical protein SAMN02745244_01562 [Tessaracoccus bendigoensis DSM 12906]